MLRDEDQMGRDTMSNHRNLFIFTFTSLCVLTLAVAVLGSALHFPALCPFPLHSAHSGYTPACRPPTGLDRRQRGSVLDGEGGQKTAEGKQHPGRETFTSQCEGKTSDMIRRIEIGWKENAELEQKKVGN